MGTDMRRQTDLDGFLRLTADEQLEMLGYKKPKMIETGHVAVTVKESLLEKIFDIGEKFVLATKKLNKPGIIGPFALQGAVVADDGKEDIVIFDVSMRIPGSPGTAARNIRYADPSLQHHLLQRVASRRLGVQPPQHAEPRQRGAYPLASKLENYNKSKQTLLFKL